MYTLYYSPATASMVVHVMLIELNVPHSLKLIDIETGAQHDPEYRKLNPNGHVPTLLINNEPMIEAAAITMHLAELHPEANLSPNVSDPTRAAYLQWFFHFANTLQPAYRLWFYAKDLPGSDHEATKETMRVRIEGVWERLNQHLEKKNSTFLLGDSISALDIYATMLMRWSRNMPKPATTWPLLDSLARRVTSRPSWKKMDQVEGNADWF